MPAVPPGSLPPMTVPPGANAPPAFPGSEVPITPEQQAVNQDCIKRLEELQLQPGQRKYPEPMPPGTGGTEIAIQTNLFGIEISKRMELYQYNVSIKSDVSASKEVVFTKKGKEDHVVLDRHKKCCAILSAALQKYENFFHTSDSIFIYDGQSLLYSSFNLFPNQAEGLPKSKLFEINGAGLDHKELESLPCIKLEVYATKNPHVKFTPEDIARRSSDSNIASINRAYHQIIELALNQECIQDTSRCVVFEHGKLFFFKPLDEGYTEADIVDVGDGKQMMPGIKKTVNFVEGPFGRGQVNPSVVIDGMKVAFHKEQLVLEKLKDTVPPTLVFNGLTDFDKDKCASVIKGLSCYTNYTGRTRFLRIEGIHHENANTSRFELPGGQSSSVFDYFKDKYNIILQYPKTNLIICKERGNQNFFPMELLTISPHQRVTIAQQTSAQSQRTTKESAVLPDVRQRLIMTGKISANISDNNRFLNGIGVAVCEEPLVTKARQLAVVKLASQCNGGVVLPQRDGKWRINQYTRPAKAPQIWACYCVGNNNVKMDPTTLGRFATMFVETFKAKGANFEKPKDMCIVSPKNIEAKLVEAANCGCKFAFVITDDSITNLHYKYKALENQLKMVIQDMKVSKAVSVVAQQKRLTLENVINKTNVKLGGTNYVYQDAKNRLNGVLVIGVGVSQPPPGTKFTLENKGVLNPLIVGFAYNAKESQEFCGDFVLASSGQDTLVSIEDVVIQAMEGYKKGHNGADPKRIIVFRSGSSDGSHGNIMAFEVPLAVAAARRFTPNVQLVYITVSKDHTYRFFKPNLHDLINSTAQNGGGSQMSGSSRSSMMNGPPKPCDLNVGPGLMVDSFVTNPACKQFFLNSHITLQGTAKTPLYTVLYDETNAPMTALEELTFSLCHLHQIVGLPTSLPAPLYVANEYAKRGRGLWSEAHTNDTLRRATGNDERNQLLELTASISYKNNEEFFGRRVNA